MAADSNYAEEWYKAKQGRLAPSVEARLRAEANSSASRQETKTPESGPARTNWINDHHRAKYGRDTAYEERERGKR